MFPAYVDLLILHSSLESAFDEPFKSLNSLT